MNFDNLYVLSLHNLVFYLVKSTFNWKDQVRKDGLGAVEWNSHTKSTSTKTSSVVWMETIETN